MASALAEGMVSAEPIGMTTMAGQEVEPVGDGGMPPEAVSKDVPMMPTASEVPVAKPGEEGPPQAVEEQAAAEASAGVSGAAAADVENAPSQPETEGLITAEAEGARIPPATECEAAVAAPTEVGAVKRPAGGAYGEWLRANRAEIEAKSKEAGGTKMTDVTKKASELWKAMPEAEKAQWVKKYEEHKVAFEAYKSSDSYVAPEPKKRKQQDDKLTKDPNTPKKPVAGAYGVFSNERRDEFVKQAAANGDKGFGAGAKLASEAWKALSEEEKAVYQKKYEEAKDKYDKDLAEHRAAHPQAPSRASITTPTKRRRSDTATPNTTASRTTKAADPTAGLPASVLETAEKLGYRSQLLNLAGRAEVCGKGCSGQQLLDALKAANGLVNKAKAAIIAGA